MNQDKKIEGLRKLIEEKRLENDAYARILSQYESYRIQFLDDIEYQMYPAHSIFSSDTDSDSYAEDEDSESSDASYSAPISKKSKKAQYPDIPSLSIYEKVNSPKKRNTNNSGPNLSQSAQPSNRSIQNQNNFKYQIQRPPKDYQINNLISKLFPAKSCPSFLLNFQAQNIKQTQNANQPQNIKQLQNVAHSIKENQPQNSNQIQNTNQPQIANKPQDTNQPNNIIQPQKINQPQNTNQTQNINQSQNKKQISSTNQNTTSFQRSKPIPITNQAPTINYGTKHFLFPSKTKLTPQPSFYSGSIPGLLIPNRNQNIYDNPISNSNQPIDLFIVSESSIYELISKYRETLKILQEQQFINYLHQISSKNKITAEIVEKVYKIVQQNVNECKSMELIEKLETATLDPTSTLYLQQIINNQIENGCNQLNLDIIRSKIAVWEKASGIQPDQFIMHISDSVKPHETAKLIDSINVKALKYDQSVTSKFIIIDDDITVENDIGSTNIDNNNNNTNIDVST